MRGIFALWVLLFHLGKWSPVSGWDQIPVISRGYLAVDFFFVLSGFILGRRHGPEFLGCFNFSVYLVFIGRRVGRLFPLHWFVLAGCVAILIGEGDPLRWWFYIFGEIALLHRWNIFYESSTTLNPPDWSISIEWAASLLFPLFVFIGLRKRRAAALMACVCGCAIIVVAWRHAWSMDVVFANSWLPLARCLAEFGIGVSLAFGVLPKWLSRDRMVLLSAIVLVITVLMHCDLASVAVQICLIASLSENSGRFAHILSATPLHWLGKVSYSVYLVQIPVLLLARKAAEQSAYPLPIYWFGSVAAILVVSWTSYKFVERPGVRLSRRLFRVA